MTRRRFWRRGIVSVSLWWITLTLVLRLLGRTTSGPTDLLRCVASAALLVAVGEVGDRLRRRRQACRTTKRS
ncbi:hypothetical protein ACF07T_18185 [Streptomyces sp. NPDC015184]|uniref:hypothetical protein n=1 Tax=Streptomyces sp. NPDC015184 TaxID=3364946 RepID=UPI0036F66F83